MSGYGPNNGAMTTPTSSPATPATDPRPLLERAIATGGAVVADIRSDQHANLTPCPEMDVRAMLVHLIGVLDRIAALGNGGDPFAVPVPQVADGGWADAWQESARNAAQAWSDDALLVGPMALPWIQGSGADVLASYLSEVSVHTWDLAAGTGQQPDWDEKVIDAALQSAHRILPPENRRALYAEISAAMGLDEVAMPFAEAVPVPDDAPAIDRLVAWNGRDPLW